MLEAKIWAKMLAMGRNPPRPEVERFELMSALSNEFSWTKAPSEKKKKKKHHDAVYIGPFTIRNGDWPATAGASSRMPHSVHRARSSLTAQGTIILSGQTGVRW